MLIDISPLISEKIAVWPGDVAFSRSWQCRIAEGSHLDLSSLTSTVHVGAHADAPSHYHAKGQNIAAVNLEPYVGPCYVQTCSEKVIKAEHCTKAIAAGHRRILFRTLSQPNPEHFNEDFSYFAPEAIVAMGKAGVVLVGIDTASVDAFDSKDLKAHQALFEYKMRNLEGLVLAHVEDGPYELIALPLKLDGFDASPVRAVLRTLS